MKRKITIELNSTWVLSHRDDDVRPADWFSEALKEEYGSDIGDLSSSFTEISLVTEDLVADGLRGKLAELFAKKYPGDEFEKCVTLNNEEWEDTDAIVEAVVASVGEIEELVGSAAATAAAEEKAKPADEETKSGPNDKVAAVLKEIDETVGSDEFKAIAHEIAQVAPEIVRNKTYDSFTNQSYLFAINDGYGLSEYLRLFAQLIGALNIRPIAEKHHERKSNIWGNIMGKARTDRPRFYEIEIYFTCLS